MNGATNHSALNAAPVPPKLASRRHSRAWLAIGAMLIFVAGAMLFWFNPAQYRLYPFCLFHELTGLNCPGCGGTRALHQLLHGHVMTALHANALVVISLPLFAWLGVRFAVRTARGSSATRKISPAWFWFFLALAVVFAVLRNLPWFVWLSP